MVLSNDSDTSDESSVSWKEVSIIRFYYENCCGNSGYFTLKKSEIPRAIMSAWNIEAHLYIIDSYTWDKKPKDLTLVFSPIEDNEANNDFLKQFGLYMIDGKEYRELHYIKDDSLAWKPNNYDGILQLV